MAITSYTWPGLDTTVMAISSAVLLFAQNPDQWELLRADPSLAPSAVREVLRVHTPVQYFTRQTAVPADVGGVTLPSGSRALMMYGCANRDECRFAQPDRFDIRRNPTEHLAFGRGGHRCVGANLAGMEVQAILLALASKVRRFVLNGEVDWLHNNVLHGPSRLPISLVAG